MNKIWIVLGFLAAFAVVGHADSPSSWEYEEYEEEAYKEYQNNKEDNDYQNKHVVDFDAARFKDNDDIAYDEAYVELLDRFNNETVDGFDNEPINKNIDRDDIDDYQIEDNRSEVKDDTQDSDGLLDNVDDIDLEQKESNLEEEAIKLAYKNSKEKEDDQHPDDYDEDLLEEEASEDVAENIPVNNNSLKPLGAEQNEESKTVLRDDEYENIADDDDDVDFDPKKAVENTKLLMNATKNFDEGAADEKIVDSDATQNANVENFIDETKKILEETNEAFDEEINMDEVENDDINSNVEEGADSSFENKSSTVKDEIDEEKSNDNEEEDSSDGSEGSRTNSNLEDHTDNSFDDKSDASSEKDNMDDDTVAEAYSDLMDDLTQLRVTWMKLKGDVNDANLSKENLPGFDELDTKLADMAKEVEENDIEVIDDKDLSELSEELSEEEFDDDNKNEMVGVEEDEEEEEEKEFEPELPDEETPEDLDSISSSLEKSDKIKLIKYVDDALIANDGAEISKYDVESSTSTMPSIDAQKHMVEPLQDIPILDNIFTNEEEKKPVDPIRITLNLEKPVVLTSPNYPEPYPTDAFIDWLLVGKGRGIEFNITDFAVNSNEGDYVMVNPGSEDTSSDGIILSHHLSSPRSFRFLDVDRVFIRFEAKGMFNRFQGFRFSVQLLDPLPEEDTSEPESQPIGYPQSTLTLNLGGVTLDEFLLIQEDFRQIVADMATMYIEANQIEPGLNTTLEVTQITSTALCFHNWPQFERCAEVRFGVPLQYEDDEKLPRLHEDDLRDMWFTFSKENPFALRLQRLGIMDFQVPNDNNVLMVWLIIAAGVVISMAMLAFALWRYSCFEDYTRMPAFSDTESVNEKKTLDLYPTPHQSLPPLYSHSEYKWGEAKYDDSTRVDMSGYANRSYARTDDYDFDSEEEVAVPARDRYTTDV